MSHSSNGHSNGTGRTDHHFATRAIHSGEHSDPATGAHNTPIYQTATYAFHDLERKAAAMAGEADAYFYTRLGNPTNAAFEQKVADLEGGEAAVAGASGMAVIAAAFFALVQSGDHVVASDAVYHWAEVLFSEASPTLHIEVTRVDPGDLDAVRAAIRPNTRMLYTELLSNPGIRIADIAAWGALAQETGIPLVVDNTFTSPYLVRPLEHGASLSLHSATKYLSGHGDALAGVITGSAELIHKVRHQIQLLGSPLSPFNAWLILRGIRTLDLRMERHCDNAARLAEFLSNQPEVEQVNFAGLPSHPNHEAATRLMGNRYGGMLSFVIRGGVDGANQFANALRLADHAVSLGDVNTLVWPYQEGLIRVSVGCEHIDDLIADFEQAFEATSSTGAAAAVTSDNA